MSKKRMKSAREALELVYLTHRPSLGPSSVWESEESRWHELVFCLLQRVCSRQDAGWSARGAMHALVTSGLLDVTRLAAIPKLGSEASNETSFILQILAQWGFTAREASAAVIAVVELASTIQRKYSGKIQRFLRESGNEMLNSATRVFSATSLRPNDLDFILRHWFQNVLNMPVSLNHQAVERFRKQRGITSEEMITIVDDIGLNLAVVDDLLIWHQSQTRGPRERRRKQPSRRQTRVGARR